VGAFYRIITRIATVSFIKIGYYERISIIKFSGDVDE